MKRITIYLIFLAALMACGGDDSDDEPTVTKEYIVVNEVVRLNDNHK